MKAIILAGGHGTRLHPVTRIINKHYLLVYDKPLIYYAIETLRDAGITDIVITLGDHDTERIFDLVGDGSELGVNIDYHYHGAPRGIAHAIYMCQDRIGDEPFIVHLGDNWFVDGLKQHVDFFKRSLKPMVLLKNMPWTKAKNYGVATLRNGRIINIIEKPTEKTSTSVVLGAYFLDKTFFDIFKRLSPSRRGEFEITDALRFMDVGHSMYHGKWYDIGTFDDVFLASKHRRKMVQSSV